MTKIRKTDLYLSIVDLRERVNRLLVTGNDCEQEIKNILRTLKLHGEGHMVNDLTPQFRQLCDKVEAVRDRMDILESQGTHTCHNHAALQEDRKRIVELEKYQTQLNASENIARICVRLNVLEEANSGLWEKVEGLEKTHNGICTQKSTEDWLNKLSEEQDKLQEQIKGLEHRLARARDDIADIHPSGCLCGEKKSAGRPKKPVKAGKVQ